MNENRLIRKNYILIIKTLHGDPGENITIVIKGTNGSTEKLSLGKSQSHHKTFKNNQTDLFLLPSDTDVDKIIQIEFYPNANAKFKEWKYTNIFIIHGTRVYRNIASEHSLLPSIDIPFVVNVVEPFNESQESIYYAFVKTGNDPCSKGCYPKLSLYGNNQQHTEIDLKSSYLMRSSSLNNNISLEKYQFDIFQWQDYNIGNIERMHLQLYSETKHSKSQWPIEWIFVIHNGYSFTGRIMLNRIIRPDRFIGIDLEQRIYSPILSLTTTGEHGDSTIIQKNQDDNVFLSNILNKQSNATTDEIGRYYILIRNIDGTSGDVYIEFHGDRLTTSGEQLLSKCENYPDHSFGNKHTDLFHVKAIEIGHIHSIFIRLDQTNKEHSLTLDSLYIIHNAIMYEFDLKHIILNKEQPKKEFIPLAHPSVVRADKVCYYIATHTADKMLSGTNASFKVVITGTQGMIGPIELKESLTNGDNPFEKECIDLFRIEDNDIGDPLSVIITLEEKGLMPHIFSGAKCERIMVVKDGEYNSLWQMVGDLKANEPKTISLPPRQRQSLKDSPKNEIIPIEPIHSKTADQVVPPHIIDQIVPSNIIDHILPSETKTTEHIETKSMINNIQHSPSGDYREDNLTMAAIEDHQKRHTFAPNLSEAQQNYRDLRRLLKKMNEPISKEQKTRKRSTSSTRQKTKKIS